MLISMAKRFIDSEIFDDPWFMDLSKDAKLLYVYMFSKCDHAGIINLNKKLCAFQTGIKGLDKPLEELGNRLLTLNDGCFFLTRYIKTQYPNFPNSKVRQQFSAIKILISYGLYDEEKEEIKGYQTLSKGLPNSYGNGSGNDNDIGNGNELVSKEEKPKRKIIPPKLEWVKEYCNERKNNIDAEEFIDFYTSKNWMVGKTKMNDWQASVRTWERARDGTKQQRINYDDKHKYDNGVNTYKVNDKWKDKIAQAERDYQKQQEQGLENLQNPF